MPQYEVEVEVIQKRSYFLTAANHKEALDKVYEIASKEWDENDVQVISVHRDL